MHVRNGISDALRLTQMEKEHLHMVSTTMIIMD